MRVTAATENVTVGELATFVLHALRSGASLDTPVQTSRSRASVVVEMSIDIAPQRPSTPAAAIEQMSEATLP